MASLDGIGRWETGNCLPALHRRRGSVCHRGQRRLHLDYR
nr:hypothetical protein [Zea mays]